MNLEQFKNPDGTYNGIAMLSALSGLSNNEISWTAERIRTLMIGEGKSKSEAKAIVTEEVKSKPWIVIQKSE